MIEPLFSASMGRIAFRRVFGESQHQIRIDRLRDSIELVTNVNTEIIVRLVTSHDERLLLLLLPMLLRQHTAPPRMKKTDKRPIFSSRSPDRSVLLCFQQAELLGIELTAHTEIPSDEILVKFRACRRRKSLEQFEKSSRKIGETISYQCNGGSSRRSRKKCVANNEYLL